MNSNSGADAISHIALTVFRLNAELLQWGDRLVAPLGLTSARWQMLGAIALAGAPLTAPQVGAAMGVTRQGAQKQLNLLLEQGMIEMHSNPAHQRSPLYKLTPKGQTLYDQADALWSAQAVQLAARLSPPQLEATKQTLVSILHQLQTNPLSLEAQS